MNTQTRSIKSICQVSSQPNQEAIESDTNARGKFSTETKKEREREKNRVPNLTIHAIVVCTRTFAKKKFAFFFQFVSSSSICVCVAALVKRNPSVATNNWRRQWMIAIDFGSAQIKRMKQNPNVWWRIEREFVVACGLLAKKKEENIKIFDLLKRNIYSLADCFCMC